MFEWEDAVERRTREVWGDEAAAVKGAIAWAIQRVVRTSDPKSTARPAGELTAAAGETITASGIGSEAALRVFTDVLEPATRAQDDPLNLAYIPSAPTRAAVAFDLVTSSANIFGGLWEAGAGAIWAENQTLEWLASLAGWDDRAEGCFVSGGTIGNLSALAAARDRALRRRGGRPERGWQVACSAGAHSSVAAAARVLDVEVVDVPTDDTGHLVGTALRTAVTEPERVFAVVASAGTTNAGIIDDLQGVADVCREHDIWLHVDGAYGGAGLASPLLRPQYAGIEHADSFIVDPHKWLFAPYDCCALLYRDGIDGKTAHAQHASYLDMIDRSEPNPSDLAIHLSRRARGLPLWFSLATHGTDAYANAIDTTVRTARQVAAAIRTLPYLRLVLEPELTVLLFERPGWTDEQCREWSAEMSREGVILCLPTQWQGRQVMRLAFVNPATDPDTVIEILRATMADD